MTIKWSLLKKIQILIIFILLIVYGIPQIFVINHIEDVTRETFETNSKNIANLLEKSIEVYFGDISNGLIYLKDQYSDTAKSKVEIMEDLKILQETNSFVLNTYIGFEDKSLLLVPEPEIPIGDDFDPTTREWYQIAKGTSVVSWSKPYTDKATNNLVITGSLFVEMENTSGVIAMDISLKELANIIKLDKNNGDVLMMLANSKGEIFADSQTDYDETQQNYQESQTEYIVKTFEDLGDEMLTQSTIITGKLRTDKGIYYFNRLSYTDIRLVTFISYEELNRSGNNMKLILTVVVFAALIIGIFIAYMISRQITNPLANLIKTMISSSEKGDLLLYEGSGDDEIKSLIEGYNSMVMSLKDEREKLQKVSSDLMISERKLKEQYVHTSKLAYSDYLTNIPNRVMFESTMNQYIKDDFPFALCYIDLDNFKHINDTYGHQYGDQVLIDISLRLDQCCDGVFFCARLSGDEFALLAKTNKTTLTIETIAKKVLRLVETPIQINELEFILTASLGISLYPEDGSSYEVLLANADIAMYEAKKMNKNQYQFYQKFLKENLINRLNLESRLLLSIANKELWVSYQPLIDFKSKQIYGFEALVRWSPKDLGNIFPDEFIPMAEHNLFINELGDFVLKNALSFSNRLNDIFGCYFEMNVNVSVVQMHEHDFVNDVMSRIIDSKVPPETINLEMTESTALDKDQLIQGKLTQLRKNGLKISLDDFGTGYSSLSHVLRLSLTHMKIDRSIILDAIEKEEVYQLVAGLVEFAHKIGLKVIAEGIEDEHTQTTIENLNFDYAQGYLYSKPVTEDEIIDLIHNYKPYLG